MTELETAWLAGLLEGEGCFHFNKTPKITVSMTDEDVIARIAAFFATPYHSRRPKDENCKMVFITEVHSVKAIALMNAILPFMGLRRAAKIREVMMLADARQGPRRGEQSNHAKLTDAQAAQIRACYIKGIRKNENSSSAIAARFGVSVASVWYVVNKRQEAAEPR